MSNDKKPISMATKIQFCLGAGAALLVAETALFGLSEDPKNQEFTFIQQTGPELHNSKWAIETDKGVFAITGGLTYMKDKPDLTWGGDVIKAFEKGATYCAETLKYNHRMDALTGRDEGRPERFITNVSKKPPGGTCPI